MRGQPSADIIVLHVSKLLRVAHMEALPARREGNYSSEWCVGENTWKTLIKGLLLRVPLFSPVSDCSGVFYQGVSVL